MGRKSSSNVAVFVRLFLIVAMAMVRFDVLQL